jgi:hypothetical protein
MLTIDRMVQELMVLGLDTGDEDICKTVVEFLDAEDSHEFHGHKATGETLQKAYMALRSVFFASFPQGI